MLSDLPIPTVIETPSFEAIVLRKKTRLKELLAQKGIEWVAHPSDDFTTLIELDAYDEILLRARVNDSVKQQLLAFATGANLDHVATKYGEIRLLGSKPYAGFRFYSSLPTLTIPKGVVLSDGGLYTGSLIEDVEVANGNGVGFVELDEYVGTSNIQLSNIITQIPYLVKIEQMEIFNNGASEEKDDDFRERVWLGRDKKTTAGSESMYKYYVLSADARIKQVHIVAVEGVVHIYFCFDSEVGDETAKKRIEDTLSSTENYPLSDTPIVHIAQSHEVLIQAQIRLINNALFTQTEEKVKNAIASYGGKFEKNISLSKIYELLGDKNIEEITLLSPLANVVCESNRFLKLNLELNYV